MSFGTYDAALVLGLYSTIFFQKSNLTEKEIQEIYNKRKKRLTYAWAAQAFGFVWKILYCLLLISAFLWMWSGASPENPHYLTLFVLFIINIEANKEWSVYFWEKDQPKIALFMIFVMIGCSLVYQILLGMNGTWWSFALGLPYLLWICVALIWNIQWICNDEEKEDTLSEGDFVIDLQKDAINFTNHNIPQSTVTHKRMNVSLKTPSKKNDQYDKLKL